MIDHDFLILLHYLFHCKEDDDPLPEIGPTGMTMIKEFIVAQLVLLLLPLLHLLALVHAFVVLFDGKWSADFAPLDSSYFPSLFLLI